MSVPRSILIVEDEPLIAMMLEDFILSLGHDVSGSCDSVKSALAEVEAGKFDLAILDVNLKGESVWPVAAALRKKGTPFVLASGRVRGRADDRKALHDRPGDPDHRRCAGWNRDLIDSKVLLLFRKNK
jgi:DNA-binding response OmpR family regulator